MTGGLLLLVIGIVMFYVVITGSQGKVWLMVTGKPYPFIRPSAWQLSDLNPVNAAGRAISGGVSGVTGVISKAANQPAPTGIKNLPKGVQGAPWTLG